MERIVNNGSKSGFTDIHMTSKETNPFTSEGFYLKKLTSSKVYVSCFGQMSDGYSILSKNDFVFLHPDWLIYYTNEEISSLGAIEDSVWVIPTSSSRTVHLKDSNLYLKLCYPGVIGRLNRELKYPQLISGIELTSIFEQAICRNEFPAFFDYMPEPYGRILKKGNIEIGFIIREMPTRLNKYFMIPGFSLFSTDRNRLEDEPLLTQILYQQSNPYLYFLHEICYPLIDIFFSCVSKEGLVPEMHSQNIIFAFDPNWHVKKIVLRDFESIDKDISIRSHLGKSVNFAEYPYKCIIDAEDAYLKRHSFMFDHKLCEYLIEPLVQCAASYLDLDVASIQTKIKEYSRSNYSHLLDSFFPPNNCWYKYPNTEIDRTTSKRPFISMGKSIYR